MADFISIGDYVLYNNHHLVAFNKPAGVPVQPDPTEDPSLLQLGSTYCKTSLQLIHRIDRPVSGVVLLPNARTPSKPYTSSFVIAWYKRPTWPSRQPNHHKSRASWCIICGNAGESFRQNYWMRPLRIPRRRG